MILPNQAEKLTLSLHTGIGLATFAGILATIYYFKPQQVAISVVFLAVISFVLGRAMEFVLPKKGLLGRMLNPHPVSDTFKFWYQLSQKYH
jgi:hypothetical protein